MTILRAFFATIAILIGSIGNAQSATNTMAFTMDDAELALLDSPDFDRAPSRWTISSTADFIDEITVIGYLLNEGAIDKQVHVRFEVWNLPDDRRIEGASIQITNRGDEGGWSTTDLDERAVIDVIRYGRSDAGLLVEATFSGNPDYWPIIYKTPQERGPFTPVSGSFSIFFPSE